MQDYELWDGIFEDIWVHYFDQEDRPGIIEVFDHSFTFELRLVNHPLKYYRVSYTTNSGKVLVDWASIEQIPIY